MKAKNLIPKVLIAAPVSQRHEEVFKEWIKHLDKLTYSNFEVAFIDTTLDEGEYYSFVEKVKIKGKCPITLRHNWNPDKQHPIQMLADARDKLRHYFLQEDYDYLFWLDDDIFIPENSIQRLLSHNKDCVGFYAHVFYEPHQVPCLLKSGDIIMGQGLNFFSFEEIDEYKRFVDKFRKDKLTESEKLLIPFFFFFVNRPQLINIYGVNIGCLLVKRKVMVEVPFRTHPTFINGEDLWFFAEANDKNFEFWCDTDERVKHKNTEWDTIISKTKMKMEFFIAHGPADAKNVDFIDRNKDGKNK